MKSNTVMTLAVLAIVAIAALMAINFAPKFSYQITNTAIPPMQIKGIDVVLKGTPYTLNYDQQKIVGDAIQNAKEVKKSDYPTSKGPFSFDKIVIHRFDSSDVEVYPIQFAQYNLVFSAPVLGKEYYMEVSGGALQKVINAVHE